MRAALLRWVTPPAVAKSVPNLAIFARPALCTGPLSPVTWGSGCSILPLARQPNSATPGKLIGPALHIPFWRTPYFSPDTAEPLKEVSPGFRAGRTVLESDGGVYRNDSVPSFSRGRS